MTHNQTPCTPLISVIVLTYKQEQTIGRTLDSILAQKSDFPFEIVIGEDCSSDGTRAICERYVAEHPTVIRMVPQAPNKGVLGNYATTVAMCQGKYIGVCAGDDWWHNPQKLQMQVAYLESHPACVLCYTDYTTYVEADGSYQNTHSEEVPEQLFETLIDHNFIGALTVVYRQEMLQHLDFALYQSQGFRMEDYPMWLEMSLHGTFGHIAESTATYTKSAGSLSGCNDFDSAFRFERSAYEIRSYFLSKNPASCLSQATIDKHWHKRYFHLSTKYNQRQEAQKALRLKQNKGIKDWKRLILCSNTLMFRVLTRKRHTRK